MSQFELTKTRLANGVWEGILCRLEPGETDPDIHVLHHDQNVPGFSLTADGEAGNWALSIPVPKYAIADGVHTFTIVDRADDSKLGDFTLMAGEVMADDLRAEIELLRAELDMLKRAFRRHCVETS